MKTLLITVIGLLCSQRNEQMEQFLQSRRHQELPAQIQPVLLGVHTWEDGWGVHVHVRTQKMSQVIGKLLQASFLSTEL